VLAELLKSQRAVGKTGRVYEGLAALPTLNNLHTIRELMREIKATRTLEVVLSFGGSGWYSAHRTGNWVIVLKRSTPHWIHFRLQYGNSCGLLAVERAGLIGYMDFRPIYSSLALQRLLEAAVQLDLVYIDGSHLFEDVFVDAYFVIRLPSERGVDAYFVIRLPSQRGVVAFDVNPRVQAVSHQIPSFILAREDQLDSRSNCVISLLR
jgi:hypothetical protein